MEAFDKSLQELNEYQRAAVIDRRRVLLVNAHVGSGKTTVLIHKVLFLHFIKGVPFQSMVVLTFTNKAAEEIKNRIKQLNPQIRDEELKFFGTFHSVARTLLTSVLPIEGEGFTRSFSIADPDEILEIFERIVNENKLTVKYRNKIRKRIDKYRQGHSLYGNMKHDDDIESFLELLKKEKIKCNIMEFDDLIAYTIKLLPYSDFCPEWIIVDEFQDCDSSQLDIIELMSKGRSHIFAVGDPNQVIYSWRGGNSNVFELFKSKYDAAELTLPVNYRSTSTILNAAKAFIEKGHGLEGVRDKGSPIIIKKHHNTFNEVIYLCERIKKLAEKDVLYSDIAIFYRKQKNADVFKEVFDKHNIPYEVSIRKSIKDIPVLYWIVRLLKASVNVNDKGSILFVLKSTRYGLSMSSKKAEEAFKALNNGEVCGLDIINRIKGFEAWCKENQDLSRITPQSLFNYLDLSSYLMPTSVSYKEDEGNVMKLFTELLNYVEFKQSGLFDGVRDYVDKSALYGSQFLSEAVDKNNNSVKLMTLHASKGLEFRHVFISGANLGSIPLLNKNVEEEQEEQRLFFVGMTRARDSLEISYHVKPEDFGVYGVPSPYLRMIPQELIDSEDFGSRASSLSRLRKEIKNNIEDKEKHETAQSEVIVTHDKYGEGRILAEDDENITVMFETYGEKTFSKLFCPLKYQK